MPDKDCERFHFEALRRALVEVPSGDPERPEPPDFLLVRKGHRLGIELTTFHLSTAPGKHPHQEQQSLKDRIVEIAERLHHDAGGPALYVSIFFHEHRPLTKEDTQPLARALADAVLDYRLPSSFKEPAVEIPWQDRPERIAAILVHGRSVDGVDRLWEADAGGWVAKLTQEDVAQVVRAKARRASLARNRCDDLWLVIVNDDFSRAAPAEISNEALEATYEAPFDRLIWLLPHAPRAIDLRIRQPVAW